MDGAAPVVTIVLVTYYGAAHLDRLWASLLALDYPRGRWRLLVVENGAERAAARWFAEHAPDVDVRVPGTNTGYAGGNAIGMDEALAAGADYVAVLTQDTDVAPGWLASLVEVAERLPRAGAVQPKILRRTAGGAAVIHSRGNELHYLGIGYVGGDGEADRTLDVRSIGYASGAGVLYRAAALAEVGGFDPAMFMYHEDTDLSWRLRLAGWDVVLAPDAVMWHEYRFDQGPRKLYFIERNRIVNLLTHYRVRTLVLLAPALVALELATFAYAVAGGWWRARVAVWGSFRRPSTWRYVVAKRRRVQALRRVGDAAVARHLTGRIAFPHLPAVGLRLMDATFGTYWRLVRPLIR